MLGKAIQTLTVILCLCAAAALFILILAAANPAAWGHIGGELHEGFRSFFGGLGYVLQQIGLGIVIIFVAVVSLGFLYGLGHFVLPSFIDLKHQAKARVIKPGPHGPAQAVQYVLPDGSLGFHDLANTAMPVDAAAMLTALRQSMQANYTSINTIDRQSKYIAELEAGYEEEGDDDNTVESAVARPTIAECVSAVERNSLTFVPGRSLSTRELTVVELEEAHIKIIGGSRMGKSCGAASIVDQMRQTHDHRRLRLVLLDPEHKNSKLFADDPLLLEIKQGRTVTRMHAKDPKEIAEQLLMLYDLMLYRYTLSDEEMEQEAHILVYFEEFLDWKRNLARFVSKEMRERALTAFTSLATRGIKAGIHLMICAQVDYADDELKEAMAQFLAVNMSFSVKPTAAQAAGFVQTELLNENYARRVPGQCVIEKIGGSDILVSPDFDVKARLKQRVSQGETRSLPAPSENGSKPDSAGRQTGSRNENEDAPQDDLQRKLLLVMEVPGEGMVETLKRVWNVSPGKSANYDKAKEEYAQVQAIIHAMARKGMQQHRSAEMEDSE